MKKILLSVAGITLLSTSLFAKIGDVTEKKGYVSYTEIETTKIKDRIKEWDVFARFEKQGFKIDKAYQFNNINYKMIFDKKSETSVIITNDDTILIDNKMLVNKKGELISKIPLPFKKIDMKKYNKNITFSLGKKGLPEIYIISDPDCPGCIQLEEKGLDSLSEKYRVNVILISLYDPVGKLHPNSNAKIEDILSEPMDKRRNKLKEIQGGENENWISHKAKEDTLYHIKYKEMYKDLKFGGTPSIYSSEGRKLR